MRPRAVTIGLALAALLASGSTLAADRPAAVETCLGCHAIPGYKNAYPTYHVPKLGGQHAQYIVDSLRAYANGERPHSTMHANAVTLTDEEIQAIAAWFEAQGE